MPETAKEKEALGWSPTANTLGAKLGQLIDKHLRTQVQRAKDLTRTVSYVVLDEMGKHQAHTKLLIKTEPKSSRTS